MPVRFAKASSEGRWRLSSLTSMYSVQLEKLTLFSCLEWSSEVTVSSPVFAAAGMPQALSPARPPAASAPPPTARSTARRPGAHGAA
ncbi:hypothetical protein GA0115252_126514, partial [Streptomyces sp. DfronAA-171]